MKHLWTQIDKMSCRAGTKYKIAVLLLGTLAALAGFSIWLIVRIWALSTTDWMICFIGYPFLLACMVIFFYSVNHAFHNGRSFRKKKIRPIRPRT